jgi:ribose 5-phosphate isomerase B
MDNNEQLIIGCDHAGYELKTTLIDALKASGYHIEDKGTYSAERADYPDFAHAVAEAVVKHKAKGILICGSGNGVNITANKHKEIRCALCWSVEIAQLARAHNDANIIAIPARFVDDATALSMVKTFIQTQFEEGRHAERVKKIEL